MYEFDFSLIPDNLPVMWQGMIVTLKITLVAIVVGMLWGMALAAMRISGVRLLSWFATGYITLFRSIPLLMVLLWFFLVVPRLLESLLGLPNGTDMRLASAMVAFTLFESAYYAEIIRAGIHSIAPGQIGAAQALGMNQWQALRHVILPQAVRNMTPLLLTQAIILFQDTSLVYVSALTDFFGAAYGAGERDGRIVEMVLFAGAVYWVICTATSILVKLFSKRILR